MHPIANSRLEMENDLRYAIKRGELISYYQPQINDDGEMIGAEALLRWRHRKIGFISPTDFIPLAEEAGLILPIGYWVLEDVCRQIKKWEHKHQLQHVAVNISSIQFKYSGFVETIKEILAKTQINPKKLMLELTEGILVEVGQVDAVINKMRTIKNL